MAATLTSNVLDPDQVGPSPDVNGDISEDVVITAPGGGVAAGDTGDYTCSFVRTPRKVLGPFSATFSGKVVSLKATGVIAAAAVVHIRVIGGA